MLRIILKVDLLEFKNGMVCEERENFVCFLIFDMGILYYYLLLWFLN